MPGAKPIDAELSKFMDGLRKRNPSESQFHDSVKQVVTSIFPWYQDQHELRRAQVLERITEPDRIISFRVSWQTDAGQIRSNRAWRVQHNNSLGPYKGGLRFRKDLTEGVLKSLAFEQTLKNSLTGLPMGGAKGGTNFNPKDKSREELMRFCQSLMTGLHRYIGEDVDVPAGDIGVGESEIGYLFGQYMRLSNRWTGVLTGKGCTFGGSAVRNEATGYGCVYFCNSALHHMGDDIESKRVTISGSGKVALYAAEKAIDRGARVLSMSDSSGFIHSRDGLNRDQIERLIEIKQNERGSVGILADEWRDIEYYKNEKPWSIPCDIAMPCATENEIRDEDAQHLLANEVKVICEGANMPISPDALERFREAEDIIVLPGKAANAGGVAVSGMELSQNAMRVSWSREKVDETLIGIMRDIHDRCVTYGEMGGTVDYIDGANVAGFRKVADGILAHGVI